VQTKNAINYNKLRFRKNIRPVSDAAPLIYTCDIKVKLSKSSLYWKWTDFEKHWENALCSMQHKIIQCWIVLLIWQKFLVILNTWEWWELQISHKICIWCNTHEVLVMRHMWANSGGGHWNKCQECVKKKTEKAMLRLRLDRYLKGYGLNRLFNKNAMFFCVFKKQNTTKYWKIWLIF
jgi:hypothetical protein